MGGRAPKENKTFCLEFPVESAERLIVRMIADWLALADVLDPGRPSTISASDSGIPL